MKICLISEYFYPYSSGGTEKYVLQLAQELISESNEVEVLTKSTQSSETFIYEGIKVNAIETDGFNLTSFRKFLLKNQFDRVHFHTLTPLFNTPHIELAKSLNIQVFFTAHVPSTTCIRGDLMQYGKTACDGKILIQRCTSCYLNKRGLPIALAKGASYLSRFINYPKTAAHVVHSKLSEIKSINQNADKIFIFTQWQKDIFIKNGFYPEKLIQTQQMQIPAIENIAQRNSPLNNRINIGFVGRISYEKGLHILIDSFLACNNIELELHIAGIVSQENESYFHRLHKKTQNNKRISWFLNMEPKSMKAFYAKLDYLCIPSIWYETGPYVLYEALLTNLPVIANDLGDMDVWTKKGYPVTTYKNKTQLIYLLKEITE